MTEAPSVQVIAYRAPSEAFRRRIEERAAGPVAYFIAGKLRNQGAVQALREVRRLSGREAIVAIENEDLRVLAGPLALIAAIGGFRKIGVVWPDGSYQQFNRRELARLLGGIAIDQVASRSRFAAAKRAAARFGKTRSLALKKAVDAKSILYLDANLSFGVAAGGSVGHIKGVIDAFVGRGFAVDFLSARAMPTDRPGTSWLKVPPPRLYSFPAELIYYAFAPIFERAAGQAAAARKYGFLYQRMSLHNFSGARLRLSLGLPLVLEYNGSEAWTAANWGDRLVLHDMAISAELAALRNADLVVTVSKVLAEEVVAAGVPQERVLVYPNCIDPAIFDPGRYSATQTTALRQRLGIAEDALVASFIGTFGTWHGVDFLGEAIRRLVDTERDWLTRNRLHFLVIGDGLKMPEIKSSVGDEPYRQFVTLAGLVPQKDAPAYLAASDIFLSPHLPNPDGTRFFGSPTKLFEYMAMQRPIIASDLDQIGKVLKGEYMAGKDMAAPPYAELFVPGSGQDFIAALHRVVDDRPAATTMAKRSRQAALSRYTWDHHVGAILERMRDLKLC